jgi:hypothetical protein
VSLTNPLRNFKRMDLSLKVYGRIEGHSNLMLMLILLQLVSMSVLHRARSSFINHPQPPAIHSGAAAVVLSSHSLTQLRHSHSLRPPQSSL